LKSGETAMMNWIEILLVLGGPTRHDATSLSISSREEMSQHGDQKCRGDQKGLG
jgi:hypothetical protein